MQTPKYKAFIVTDEKYADNTYVFVRSYFEHNTFPLTLYILGNVNADKFKSFDKLSIEKLENINIEIKENYSYYYNCIDCISAKLKIFSMLKNEYDYAVCFDTDTIVLGNMDELFKDYDCDMIGIGEKWDYKRTFRTSPYINVGFAIIKLSAIKDDIFEKYIEFLNTNNMVCFPEQDFLNVYIKNRKELHEKYNFMPNYYDFSDDVRMVHFSYPLKPFIVKQNIGKFVLKYIPIIYYDIYYSYIEKIKNELPSDFYDNCMKVSKGLNLMRLYNKVKNGKGHS